MKLKDLILYSWRNNTENKSYFLEFKDLLNIQRKKGDMCTCIISNEKTNWGKLKENLTGRKHLERIKFI